MNTNTLSAGIRINKPHNCYYLSLLCLLTGPLLHLGSLTSSSSVLWLWQLLVHCWRVTSGTVEHVQERRLHERCFQHWHHWRQCICCLPRSHHQMGHGAGVSSDCLERSAHHSWRSQHPKVKHTVRLRPLCGVSVFESLYHLQPVH